MYADYAGYTWGQPLTGSDWQRDKFKFNGSATEASDLQAVLQTAQELS